MKLKEMVELVQQHHPDLGVTEIVKMLNTAQEEYSQRTRMLERATQFDLDGNNEQRYYALDESILEIKSVDMEGADGSTDHVNIPKLVGRPVRRDLTQWQGDMKTPKGKVSVPINGDGGQVAKALG